mmetsp:Transcript_73901/g.186236  ORF Transcript_73901/g.186236 Transcript_73901/m.186236 type:complete len:280 (-) Transcript_73901:65-904(-)
MLLAASHDKPLSKSNLLNCSPLPGAVLKGSSLRSSTRRKRPQRPWRFSETTPSSRVPASLSASSRRRMWAESAQKMPAWPAQEIPSKRLRKRFKPPFFSADRSSSATSCSSSSLRASAAKPFHPAPPGQPPTGSGAAVSCRRKSASKQLKALTPYGPLMRSKCPKPKASPEVPKPAWRSPRVIAPNCRKRRVTAEMKRASPPKSLTTHVKAGGCSWLERCIRPIICTALSAAQGNSRLTMRLGRGAAPPGCREASRRSLCKEMPAEAASVMMATNFWPL